MLSIDPGFMKIIYGPYCDSYLIFSIDIQQDFSFEDFLVLVCVLEREFLGENTLEYESYVS